MQLTWITFFRFFRKSFKKLWPQFEGSFCKYDLEKNYAYSKSRNFKILTNKTNQIAGFEIILKMRCEHVTYATVGTIMITSE